MVLGERERESWARDVEQNLEAEEQLRSLRTRALGHNQEGGVPDDAIVVGRSYSVLVLL